MALNASNVPSSGGNYEPMEAGTYPARLVQIVDLGMQHQRPYQGQEKPDAREIMLTYEFVDEFMKDDNGEDDTSRPRWLSETMPLHNIGADKAKSTKRYLALDPAQKFGGDFTKLLETACSVTVVNNPGKGNNVGKVYDNIANVAPMRPKDAEKCPALVQPTAVFDLDSPDLETYARMPPWIQKKIAENLEFEGSTLQALLGGATEGAVEGEDEEETPF